MLFWTPAPPPVSYSAQVAPVMAMHCNGCHGDAGGLSTRTYRDLMAGGHLGRVILPGDPDGSLLIHFVDGRRGKEQLMPLGGRALSAEQIAVLRRWIAEGARDDPDPTPHYTHARRDIPTRGAAAIRIAWRVSVSSYVTLRILEPATRRMLLSEVFSVKSPPERVDAGEPGELVEWLVRPAASWPDTADVELVVSYAPEPPRVDLSVTPLRK
jgi:hypothetical protein